MPRWWRATETAAGGGVTRSRITPLSRGHGPSLLSAGLLVSSLSCAIAAPYRIKSYEEYARLPGPHPVPYVLRLAGEHGSLLYFGAEHSVDPAHHQVRELVRAWEDFRPTALYTEGGVWPAARVTPKAS